MTNDQLAKELRQLQEIDPDRHDGSYELMRELIRHYASVDQAVLDYRDLDAVYAMALGTWTSSVDRKKSLITQSHLTEESKASMTGLVDKIWEKANRGEYENREANQPSIGMFGTGYHTTKTKTDSKSAGAFIRMCADILDQPDEEAIFDRASKTLNWGFKGFGAASASVVLHCLKPYVFPVLNSATGKSEVLTQLGVQLKNPEKLTTFIDNCRQMWNFMDSYLTAKNYRVLDRFLFFYGKNEMNEKLVVIIDRYKDDFQKIHGQEIYKWQAVKHFQDNWNPDAEDFAAMVRKAFAKHVNLLSGQTYYPLGTLNDIAAEDPEKLRSMFSKLYDESLPLKERYEDFVKIAKEFVDGKNPGAKKQHYQELHAISVYLAFRYPEKYYIYKYSVFKHFAELIDYSPIPKMGQFEMLEAYFKMCDMIREQILLDKELLAMSKARLAEDCYQDPEYRMLTTDIVYYGRWIESSDPPDDPWWPDLETYDPKIEEGQWSELLKNEQVFNRDALIVMKRMLDIGGEATCKQLGEKYGRDYNYYRNHSINLAKRACIEAGALIPPEKEESARWWPVLYVGKRNTGNGPGGYIWMLRPELKAALEKHDLSSLPLYEKPTTVEPPTDEKQYFWLNASPKIWRFSNIKVGETQDYTLYNENRNKRRIFQNFLYAKPGDVVVGYEANPVKQIVALCEIVRENDGERLYFKKNESLANPVGLDAVKSLPELQNMEVFVNPNGSLFKLTQHEYNIILDLIRESNPPHTADEEKYDKKAFLSDVYMDEAEYGTLVSILERKRNLILEGPPGVGKTFAAKRLAWSMIGRKSAKQVKIIQFHQNYSYEDFVMGYRPNENGFSLQNGVFYKFCQLAESDTGNDYFLIIDEINRGNLSKIFGELLMLIEKDYREEKIELAYTDLPFSVPDNLYIIGTMNTADRSLAMVDYALRRRFSFHRMRPAFENEGFKAYQESLGSGELDSLLLQLKELNEKIKEEAALGSGCRIGHSYFCRLTECSAQVLKEIVTYEIIPVLREYWFDNEKNVDEWTSNLLGVLK